jgi:hypothetical protein
MRHQITSSQRTSPCQVSRDFTQGKDALVPHFHETSPILGVRPEGSTGRVNAAAIICRQRKNLLRKYRPMDAKHANRSAERCLGMTSTAPPLPQGRRRISSPGPAGPNVNAGLRRDPTRSSAAAPDRQGHLPEDPRAACRKSIRQAGKCDQPRRDQPRSAMLW